MAIWTDSGADLFVPEKFVPEKKCSRIDDTCADIIFLGAGGVFSLLPVCAAADGEKYNLKNL